MIEGYIVENRAIEIDVLAAIGYSYKCVAGPVDERTPALMTPNSACTEAAQVCCL